MISADSFAMSTAVSTEMPISAARMAAASLMPSPMNPTVWPVARSTVTMRAFWLGESLANTLVPVAARPNSSSSSASISGPNKMFVTSKPTRRQMARVTKSLSPVRILVVTPYSPRARIASAASCLGGSRKAR